MAGVSEKTVTAEGMVVSSESGEGDSEEVLSNGNIIGESFVSVVRQRNITDTASR